MKYEETFEYVKMNIPDFGERLHNIMKIYEFDISTTRKKNKYMNILMWKIIQVIDRGLESEIPVENDDIFNWAVGNIDFEELK